MNQETKNVLSIGTIVRLKTDHEEHRGKYFKVLDILENTLIKVLWQDKIYKIVGITRNQFNKMEKKDGFDYQPFQKGFSCYPEAIEIKFKNK